MQIFSMHSPQQRIICLQMSIVPRLRHPDGGGLGAVHGEYVLIRTPGYLR